MPFQCKMDDGPSDHLDCGNIKTVQNSSEEPVPHPEEYWPYSLKDTHDRWYGIVILGATEDLATLRERVNAHFAAHWRDNYWTSLRLNSEELETISNSYC